MAHSSVLVCMGEGVERERGREGEREKKRERERSKEGGRGKGRRRERKSKRSLVFLLPLIRTPALLDQGSHAMTSFNLNYCLKGSISKCSHFGG